MKKTQKQFSAPDSASTGNRLEWEWGVGGGETVETSRVRRSCCTSKGRLRPPKRGRTKGRGEGGGNSTIGVGQKNDKRGWDQKTGQQGMGRRQDRGDRAGTGKQGERDKMEGTVDGVKGTGDMVEGAGDKM